MHFEKEDKLHNLNISEVIHPEKCSYFNAFGCFNAPVLEHPFEGQGVHGSQTLLEPTRQDFYPNFL